MPFKSQETRREYNKEQMRKSRVTQKDTKQGNTTGVTHPGAAPGYKVLSDGQLWYPGNNGYHPEGCNCGIEHKEKPAC